MSSSRQAGLRTDRFDGTPFQEFQLTTAAKVGKNNRVSLVGPATSDGGEPRRIELKRGEDFTPLAMSSSGAFDLPLAFVGWATLYSLIYITAAICVAVFLFQDRELG